MANSDVIVTVSGAALSLLFYENVCSNDNQIGFLLGNVYLYVTKNVTDSEKEIEQKRTQIHITSTVTCPSTDCFYDSKGRIDHDKISHYVNSKENKIIGWFRLRKHRNLSLTFMDRILHKEIANYFEQKHGFNSEEFVMCLLNTSMNVTEATHKFQYIFHRYRNKSMDPLPLKIHNSADDVTSYKPRPVKIRHTNCDSLSDFIYTHNDELSSMSGLEAVDLIQKQAEDQLKTLIPRLCESERAVAHLESEILKMKKILKQKQRSSSLTITNNTSEFDKMDFFHDNYEKNALKNSSSSEVVFKT